MGALAHFLEGQGLALGIDGGQWTESQAQHLHAMAVTWVSHTDNLVDCVWEGRPAMPWAPLKVHAQQFSGETSKEKREAIAQT